MTLMDAIHAELAEWARVVAVDPSREQMDHFYVDTLDGGTAAELAEAAISALIALDRTLMADKEAAVSHMASWCAGVLVGARAARRLTETTA